MARVTRDEAQHMERVLRDEFYIPFVVQKAGGKWRVSRVIDHNGGEQQLSEALTGTELRSFTNGTLALYGRSLARLVTLYSARDPVGERVYVARAMRHQYFPQPLGAFNESGQEVLDWRVETEMGAEFSAMPPAVQIAIENAIYGSNSLLFS